MSPQAPAQTTTVNLTIDGKPVTVPKGTTVYTAAKKLGIEIPIFCYQDRMPPFGACRMCLVEIEKMPKLATSCTQEAAEGMVVKTQSPQAVAGRKGILEFLLVNHPLDCPICDRGGECPLQENTLKYGPGQSRFVEEKRHFEKRLPLGPVLMLDRERCIVCARCTRFGELIAGDHALEFVDRGYKTEVGTPGDKPVKSKFIGNTIMICPVGALTSDVYRFRARPWDNDSTDSVCTLCSVGCNMILDARDGEIMRTRSRENRDVNDIWLCDKGWFGYEFSSSEKRLTKPLARKNGKWVELGWEEALDLIATQFKKGKASGKIGALGGAPLTVEENFLLQKLIREGAGVNHVDYRVGQPAQSLDEEGISAGMEISGGDCERLDVAFVLGADLTEEFPVLWLRLKQAINRGAKVFYFGHCTPEIAPHLAKTVLHAPGKELDILKEHGPHFSTLAAGKKAAFFVGPQYLHSRDRRAILAELLPWRAAAGISLNLLEGKGNDLGARWAGMRPDLLPYGEKNGKPGLTAPQLLEKAAHDGWDFLYVAGADPAAKFPSKLWKQARANTQFLVVQDLFLTATAEVADLVLPAASFVEKGGRVVNIEGRVQELRVGKNLPEGVLADAEIFILLSHKLGNPLSLDKNFTEKMKLGRLPQPRPEKLESGTGAAAERDEELRLSIASPLFDRGVRMRFSPKVSQLVKEPAVRVHPQEGTKRGLKTGDAVRVSSSEGSFLAKLNFDEGVAAGTLVAPRGFPDVAIHELGANLMNGISVQLQKV